VQHFIDQQIDQGIGAVSSYVGGADAPLGFGADVPHLPGRSVLLHLRQHPIGRLGDPGGIHRYASRRPGRECPADHGFDRAAPTQHCFGFGLPGRALFG